MPKFQTSLTRLLNIDLPIVQAPMAFVASPMLVAAVSNAGGLGMLSVTWRDLDSTRQVIREVRKFTNRPFGVNLGLAWPQEERLEACLDEGVPIVSLFWGDPAKHVAKIHAAGALLMHTVGSAAEARRVSEAGVDIIVAQGWEAGGHVWGTVATLPLVPLVADAVAPKPVVAAGGIADGRGLAAALMLGAAGVWVGTRFLASEEAAAHATYKERVLKAEETDTVYSTVFDGGWPSNSPHRTLKNETITRWEMAGSAPSGQRPGEGEVIASWPDGRPINRYESTYPFPGITGDVQALALYAGQSAGLVSRIEPAGEIAREMAEEAAKVLRFGSEIVSS
ncbi:MAG TPA: nitronate monooxygenase [Anaerolineae bacterium]|nr:nitronate monooxygenase [Anaerolineae bacterium]HXV99531.1 nitronate monooxygenase [Anaerolineae bacterium]